MTEPANPASVEYTLDRALEALEEIVVSVVIVGELPSREATPNPAQREGWLASLEAGCVLCFERHGFLLSAAEQRLLDPAVSDQRAKNVAFDSNTGRLSGTSLQGPDLETLRGLVARFSATARGWVEHLFPRYAGVLRTGMTSFRPIAIEGRASSSRKDDTRLHADAFASRPTLGARILRVFCNISPNGEPRRWLVGEPFEPYARRFVSRIRPPVPLYGRCLYALRITKARRSAYDHYMLHLHDTAKLDDEYQRTAPREQFDFPAGATWICFTDQVLHAALAGQFLLEQTFYLPVTAMAQPERSPLRVLERLTQRALA